MTYATEALDFGQTLNVQRDVPAEIALNDDIVFVNVVTDLSFIVSRQIAQTRVSGLIPVPARISSAVL